LHTVVPPKLLLTSPRATSNRIPLLQIAPPAEQLNVLVRVASAERHRNDVIEFQVLIGLALGASPSVPLPDPLTDVTGNVPIGTAGTAALRSNWMPIEERVQP